MHILTFTFSFLKSLYVAQEQVSSDDEIALFISPAQGSLNLLQLGASCHRSNGILPSKVK